MTFQEAANQLMDLGVGSGEIGAPFGITGREVNRLKRLAGPVSIPDDEWKPALWRIAKEKALELETLAIRINR
jgi:hypothetical protein